MGFNSAFKWLKLTCLEITCYRIKYSTVLWLTELQIMRGWKVYTQVHTVNSNSRTVNCQCGLFAKKNPIIQIFCISGWLRVLINHSNVELNPTCHLLVLLGANHIFHIVGCDSSVVTVTGYGLDGPGIESRWERDFPHLSRPAMGPTQPPVQ